MAKTITEQKRLQAFALYTMASHHYEKCREFERGVSEILGISDGLDGFNEAVSDGLFGYDAGKPLPFDKVLVSAGVTVKQKKSKR